jgi:hypothetical protein
VENAQFASFCRERSSVTLRYRYDPLSINTSSGSTTAPTFLRVIVHEWDRCLSFLVLNSIAAVVPALFLLTLFFAANLKFDVLFLSVIVAQLV